MKSSVVVVVFALAGIANGHAGAMGAARLAPPTLIAPVHGCHGGYAHDLRGWHRHGKHCEAQRGVARAKRDKKRSI